MNYQAVLFDFDYTLGDATPAIMVGFRAAFRQMGFPEPEVEAVRRTVGYPLVEEYTMLTGDSSEAHRQEFCALFRETANPLQITETTLFPGARELLTALREAGIHTGVVSSKLTAALHGILEHQNITSLLDLAMGGDLVQRNKPDPEGLNAALAQLGLAPDQVLYCGDTVMDAGAAQGAGTDFCAVLNGTTPAEDFDAFPHVHIAPDLTDLRRWLGL